MKQIQGMDPYLADNATSHKKKKEFTCSTLKKEQIIQERRYRHRTMSAHVLGEGVVT